MSTTETPSLQRLRALLHDTTDAPGELAEALRVERHRVAGTAPIAHELLAADLRWIARQHEARDGDLAAACEAARRQWLELRERALSAVDQGDAAAIFDLADVRGEARLGGMADLAARCDRAIAALAARVANGEGLGEEASERFAVLIASVEDPSLPRQVALLRSNAEAMRELAAHGDDKTLRRFGRRLGRAADDRELASRLEGQLGRTGVTIFETTNFVLLLVVLTILTIEFTVELAPLMATTLQWIDALACTFFIGAFVYEFALHPNRWSWFVRHFLTDLAPAIPSAMFLLPTVDVPGAAENTVVIRALRLLRVTWAARYVQALRPLLRSARLLLFLVRGMDGLVQRFTRMLDREFVFVPAAAEVTIEITEDERRDLLFAALERERELLLMLGGEARAHALLDRANAISSRAGELGPARAGSLRIGASRRDVPIERAVEVLWSVRKQDVGKWLQPADISALDRVLRVLSSVPIRWLPIIRRFAVHPLPPTPEERIVALARRTAEWIEAWHSRLLFHADLHGIVTGPQILDRVATAMVKATQRPAVRLLLFGGAFLLVDKLLGARMDWLDRIVGLPLIILGSICLVGLALGRWLKSIAGEAADAYQLTSEAHFLSQLELYKRRHEDVDLPFLAQRVFDGESSERMALEILRGQIHSTRAGVPVEGSAASARLRLAANRVALLYLHFLDGAPLHISDVKTTEQLLANKAIENLRDVFLHTTRRDRKRLRKLRLDDGSLFGGPYLWFSFITESIAVEVAKRIEGYNRYCIPTTELDVATPAQRDAMAAWLLRRRDPKSGRTLAASESVRVDAYPTTEFTAIDFVGADAERDKHIAAIFGDEVVEVMRIDRRTMVREIFGTRPVNHLPKHERSFNPLRFYRGRMSHGRVLLAPLLLVWRFCRLIGWLVQRVRQIVREVLDPELAMQRREAGAAPFAVALRKIHRMKAPGLLEAVRMRLWLDPGYSGAPCGWTDGSDFVEDAEFERDLAFLHLREREAVELRDRAIEIRRAVGELHAAVSWLPGFPEVAGEEERQRGEFAVTCAWIADKDDVRTLLFAERWRTEHVEQMLSDGVDGSWLGDAWRSLCALLHPPCVDRWLERHGRDLPKSARRILRRAYAQDLHDIRALLAAWEKIPAETSPASTAIARLQDAYRRGPAIYRDVLTLRAVQSMAVLDVRNYRDLVFQLGGYADEGEDAKAWCTLP